MKNNKPKHTPGPWKIAVSDVSGPSSINNSNTRICNLPDPQITWTEPTRTSSPTINHDLEQIELNKANAHLIAAAPEMLDCLERILGAFPELGGDEPLSGADVIDYLNQELSNIKYTVAKAKGES